MLAENDDDSDLNVLRLNRFVAQLGVKKPNTI